MNAFFPKWIPCLFPFPRRRLPGIRRQRLHAALAPLGHWLHLRQRRHAALGAALMALARQAWLAGGALQG